MTNPTANTSAISSRPPTPSQSAATNDRRGREHVEPHVALRPQRVHDAADRVVERPQDRAAAHGRLPRRVGPGREQYALPRLHDRGVLVGDVVVAEQVQHAVHEQQVELRFDRRAELGGLLLRRPPGEMTTSPMAIGSSESTGVGSSHPNDSTSVGPAMPRNASFRRAISSRSTIATESSTASGASSILRTKLARRSNASSASGSGSLCETDPDKHVRSRPLGFVGIGDACVALARRAS